MYQQISPRWQPAPEMPRPVPGCIDIWHIGLVPLTSPGGSAQAQWAAANAALRELVAGYLGIPIESMRFERLPGGKPVLVSPRTTLHFNLSHCRGHALVALADAMDVGVDIEAQRPIDDPMRLARRVLSTAELGLLDRTPAPQRLSCFLDLWTRMEARQKAAGNGLFAERVDPQAVTCFGFAPGDGLFASVAVMPPRAELSLRFFTYRAR